MLIMGFSVPKEVMYVYVHVLYINSEDIDMSDISRGGGFESTSDISSVSERGTARLDLTTSVKLLQAWNREELPPYRIHTAQI